MKQKGKPSTTTTTTTPKKAKNKKESKETKATSATSNVNMIGNSTTGMYDYYCDKCGGQFTSEMELDHHDKIDH